MDGSGDRCWHRVSVLSACI
ncbi:MAG: hypothetical protein GX887_01120 [Firmicutes bacterium]|nr:hypothetical protein [Bacillota bacterium]